MDIPNKSVLWCDSSSAIAIDIAANPVLHSKLKHVELDLFFVREKIITGTLQVGSVPSQDQVVDIIIKPLSFGFFNKFRDKVRVLSRISQVKETRDPE